MQPAGVSFSISVHFCTSDAVSPLDTQHYHVQIFTAAHIFIF
jgi:hypothetical protein